VVSGTTGWDHDRERVAEMVGQHNGACLHASNFSLGVYFFQRIVLAAAAQLADFPQYDLAIHETHHTGKKDAPSGTALMLARSVLENCPRKTTIATTGPSGPVDAAMLSVTSTRVGTVVGEHRLIVDSESDSIELVHKAKGRQGFAEGALLAAEWIRDKHGMFTLEDLINDITET
jgi:4-hydroxy-tetrahydrodipicolinate reductase